MNSKLSAEIRLQQLQVQKKGPFGEGFGFNIKKPRPKGRKRKAFDTEEPTQQNKLTTKERRRLDRAQKTRKVDVRYYDTHNVKNKNKNREVPTEGNKGKRAKR